VPVFEEKNERPGNRRMATLACTYTVDRHVRTPEQIVAALMRLVTAMQQRSLGGGHGGTQIALPPGSPGTD
jgi:hypothetical protein